MERQKPPPSPPASPPKTATPPVVEMPTQQNHWGLDRFIPYFRNPENVLRAKLDLFLLLWMFIAGIMKEMDQSATTQAYVSGMREDLGLLGNELNWFQTYFSIAYAIFIVPSQMLQTKLRPSLWLPFAEITWGLLTMFTYKAKTAETVYILRFFLGMMSATSWPGITSLILTWYTPGELALRLAIFNVSDVAGAMFLGVVQAQLYVHMNGVHGLAGWQWLFIISGAITILLGLLGLFIVPDSPSNTRAVWLTPTEKRISLERMVRHKIQPARLIPWRVLRAKVVLLLRHPLTWMFMAVFAQNAWAGRANSYILLYLKGVTDEATGIPLYSTYQVNLIPLGGYALQIITNVGINAVGDYKGWRWQICVASGLVHIIACAILASWPASHAVIMFAYFLTYTTSASGPAVIAWLAELLRAEPEARSIIVGLTVTVVYVGHATIPLGVWKVTDSPQYPIGFPLAAAFAASAILVVLLMRFWFVRNFPEFPRFGYAAGEEGMLDEPYSDAERGGPALETEGEMGLKRGHGLKL
ncbi:WD domain-containing protein [Apiospora arundinis]